MVIRCQNCKQCIYSDYNRIRVVSYIDLITHGNLWVCSVNHPKEGQTYSFVITK